MKFLVVLLVVLAGVWLWRRNRAADEAVPPPPARPPVGQPPAPSAMVACAHCGLHLPAAEALPGSAGEPYCSAAHRAAGPGRA